MKWQGRSVGGEMKWFAVYVRQLHSSPMHEDTVSIWYIYIYNTGLIWTQQCSCSKLVHNALGSGCLFISLVMHLQDLGYYSDEDSSSDQTFHFTVNARTSRFSDFNNRHNLFFTYTIYNNINVKSFNFNFGMDRPRPPSTSGSQETSYCDMSSCERPSQRSPAVFTSHKHIEGLADPDSQTLMRNYEPLGSSSNSSSSHRLITDYFPKAARHSVCLLFNSLLISFQHWNSHMASN